MEFAILFAFLIKWFFLLNSNIDAKNASLVNLIVNLTFTVKKSGV